MSVLFYLIYFFLFLFFVEYIRSFSSDISFSLLYFLFEEYRGISVVSVQDNMLYCLLVMYDSLFLFLIVDYIGNRGILEILS